jgi:hypothetical protein
MTAFDAVTAHHKWAPGAVRKIYEMLAAELQVPGAQEGRT